MFHIRLESQEGLKLAELTFALPHPHDDDVTLESQEGLKLEEVAPRVRRRLPRPRISRRVETL